MSRRQGCSTDSPLGSVRKVRECRPWSLLREISGDAAQPEYGLILAVTGLRHKEDSVAVPSTRQNPCRQAFEYTSKTSRTLS